MYEIFFHVSGIALLEISFFFYYIGPKETEMFLHYIKRILDSSLFDSDKGILDIQPSIDNGMMNDFGMIQVVNDKIRLPELLYPAQIQSLLLNQTSQMQEDLYQNNLRGIAKREEQNAELFKTSIMYWGALAGFSMLVFVIQNSYSRYKDRKGKQTGVVTVLSEPQIDDIEMVRYRKTSMDNEDIESREIVENITPSYLRKICKIGTHYVVFSGCIVTFQYLFFKYIAFAYKPLSIEEIKYYLFTYLLAEIPTIPST
jgi:hypothetical protein